MPPVLIASDIADLLPMHREPGNHVSEIINRLSVKLGAWADTGDRPAQIQFEMGNAAELMIAEALAKRYARNYPERYVHGLALEKDGIHGNLDLLDTVDFAVEDVKLTKKSIKHEIEGEKYWHNWVQVMAYCYMIGSNIGRLHLVFVNGNYKFPGEKGYDPYEGPEHPGSSGWQYRVWEDRFTDQVLENNWRMLLGHRKVA